MTLYCIMSSYADLGHILTVFLFIVFPSENKVLFVVIPGIKYIVWWVNVQYMTEKSVMNRLKLNACPLFDNV